MSTSAAAAPTYENQHVHAVYNQIAAHFSSTRHKPWPIIENFLRTLPAGAIGLDVGCGNGKYLSVNRDIFIVASDRSRNLLEIAGKEESHRPHAVVEADVLELPHPRGTFDFAICIAVVHHLSTAERRVEAVRGILETLRPEGRALVYVWALEQGGSRRGWTADDEQDVMVPWVMRGSKKAASADADGPANGGQDRVFHRYYHLYREGELNQDVTAAGGVVLDSGYEKDNWWVVAGRQLT
ncbi:S-adenosyl-L-methionine-dependent methyltransferase [Neohortaea acidophila]|uniref:S-adenosyl-L-methionine-dependent methyltransferase n=1 Tax=Neohortaea acidophila TaxID=245834 RepID=A0A6A6PFF0_9PEZI|nr:S-adenosyl-L-methionine-dependent methyltransferase [Neohortaea acidophila]KAF2478709.1 S-adenosyl-L-methionine-dependent methyltransferase [Neohortaea acidophila]